VQDDDSLVYPTLSELCKKLSSNLGELGQELVSQLKSVLAGLATPDDLSRLFEALE